jgi:formate hydrogenlyase subunit 3/multisubunit Na+/H+ antiporter MnhD subunit
LCRQCATAFQHAVFLKVRGPRCLTGGLFFMATLAVTGTPPFSIFQSEFNILSAAVLTERNGQRVSFRRVVTILLGSGASLQAKPRPAQAS